MASQVATQAVSTAASMAINSVAPGWGTAISTALGIFSGLFGGGKQRQSISAIIKPAETGTFYTTKTGQKNSTTSTAQQFGDAVSAGLNSISQQTGVMFSGGYNVESNIGDKDPGTWLNKQKISSKPGDVEGAIKSILDQNKFNYDLLNAPAKTETNTSGNTNKNFTTIQDGNDPAARIALANNSGSSYVLIGTALLFILALTKKG